MCRESRSFYANFKQWLVALFLYSIVSFRSALHANGQSQSITIPFIKNDLINQTAVSISEDRCCEHPETPYLLEYLHECESNWGNCDVENMIILATKITNEYMTLLLPEKAQQLLNDIQYFTGNRNSTVASALRIIDLVIALGTGHHDKVISIKLSSLL